MYDLVLLHAPSVYNLIERKPNLGPISDLAPSTTGFEMYLMGQVSITGKLVRLGYSVRLLNIALLTLLHKDFDVEASIKKLDSQLYGLELHWLPTVHGVVASSPT